MTVDENAALKGEDISPDKDGGLFINFISNFFIIFF